MTARWQPQRGEVVLVKFPFLGLGTEVQAKLRPAVIVSSSVLHHASADVIIAAISSRPTSRPLPTDYEIPAGSPEHSAAGLKKTSWVKSASLANVPKSAVSRRLGKLTPSALAELDARLKLALGLA